MPDVMTRPLSRPLSPPMTSDNAVKMQELYGDDQSEVMTRPLSRPLSKPAENPIAQIGARETRFLDQAGEGIKKAVTDPLKETGNPIAQIGEVGGRAADVAGNAFMGAISPLAATTGQALKPLARPLTEMVAKTKGATPEQAKEIGGKLEESTSDVLGSSVAQAATMGGAKKPIASAAKMAEDGTIVTGAKHADIPGGGKEGFVNTEGKFVTREEALPAAEKNNQLVQKPVEEGKLHSEDIGRPVPQTQQDATIKTKAGDEILNTRGQGQQYHGSGAPIKNLAAYTYADQNIYGQGFYTTDAADVAHGYANRKNAAAPSMYTVAEKQPVKLFDMGMPIPSSIRSYIENSSNEALDAALEDANTLKQLYDSARQESRALGISTSEMHEDFDNMADVLRKEGYGGLTHKGGGNTNTLEHQVKIYFDPATDLTIQQLPSDAFKIAPLASKPLEDAALQSSKIFSPDQPIASTKPVTSVEGVADKLYQSRQAVRADYKEFSKWAAPFRNVPESFWQKALDHLDDPKGVPLNPQEQLIFDRSVGVMRDEIDANRKEIKASGFNPKYIEGESDSLGGAIRQRKGVGTPMDRLTGTKTAGRAPEGGKSLSRSAGTFKGRNMMALVQDGKRTIVHIDGDGNIFDASKQGDPLGQMDETGAPTTGGKIVEATRKEIEQATGGAVQYHDNAFGVYATSLLQTRRAVRSVRILNDIKKSPSLNEIARAPFSKGEVPRGWKEIPNSPEFRGWRFEPRYAEEIEDFLAGSRRDAGALNKLDKLNRFTLNLLFWANPIHAYNITDAFMVTKGAGGLLRDLPGTTKDLLQSIKSVATRDKYNMAQARSGVPMPGLDTAGEEFRRRTLDIMGVKARQDPKSFLSFIKQFGFDTPKAFFDRVGEVSHKAVFSWQDVLQQTLERGYMRKGMTQAQATEQVAKTFMNYRTPSRVGDQRWAGQALQGQAWLDFPKYSYGRLKGMYNILKGSAKLDPHAIDQLLTIAILYEFGQNVIDPWIKDITGQDNAEFGNFGYTVFPDLANKMAEGQRTPGQVAQSLFSPGYLMQGIDLASGINRYLGKPLSIPGESAGEVGMDYASEVVNKLSPMQRFGQVASGSITPDDLWLEQLGVKFPTDISELKSVRRGLRSREKHGSRLEQELE